VSRISRLLRNPSAESIKQNREQDPDVMAIDDDAADAVFSALSSVTAREILTTVYDQPRAASEIADEVETSLQNVNYHLNRLSDSGVIEVVETWYSEQGTEMKVYAPTNEALVLFAGDDLNRSSLLDVIKRLVGFVGIFALVSLIVDRVVRPVSQSTSMVVGGEGSGGSLAYTLPPGILFFLGSLFALLVLTAWWYYRSL
jgi:DNA-binding transcriptional ArsR family regulator